jgi:hypothetical protein
MDKEFAARILYKCGFRIEVISNLLHEDWTKVKYWANLDYRKQEIRRGRERYKKYMNNPRKKKELREYWKNKARERRKK